MRNSYKCSKYNITDNDDKGSTIIYNTYSGIIKRVTPDIISMLEDESFSNIGEEEFKELKEDGFIIEKSVDEDELINELRYKYVESPDSLLLYLLPTEQCNFRCVYCYEKFPNIWMSRETQDSIIEYVKNNINKYRFIRVEWFGGEPLLALDIIEYISERLIKICQENRVLYYAVMTTNAYLLDIDVFRRLKKCRVTSYQITVDGSKEVHDSQRMLVGGGGTYEQIMKNLIEIKNNIKTRVLDVTLRVNVSKKLLENIYNVIDSLNEKLLIDTRFKLKLVPVGDYGGDKVHEIEDQICCMDDLKDAINYCKELGIDMSEYQYGLSIGGNVCYASRDNSWVIGADGKIYKCTVILYNDENHIGDVRANGIFDINKSKLNKWIQRSSIHNEKCESCTQKPICLETMCYKRIILGQKPVCESLMADVKMCMHLFD